MKKLIFLLIIFVFAVGYIAKEQVVRAEDVSEVPKEEPDVEIEKETPAEKPKAKIVKKDPVPIQTLLMVDHAFVKEISGYSNYFPVRPVVQFTCVVRHTPIEDTLKKILKGSDDVTTLIALGKLVGRPSPSSVDLQYKAFQDLKLKYATHESIIRAAAAFNIERVKSIIAKAPPGERYVRASKEYYWGIRAAGVMQLDESIPRLLELSEVDNLYTNLAAARSIMDFDGEKGEDALLKVISCWQYNAYVRAGNVMVKRNPAKLSAALEKMTPPPGCRYQYALFLAQCNNPKAVPILCDTVKDMAIIDGKMFDHIANLGRPQDKDIIMALPMSVRDEQKYKARKCVKKYLERMKEK